MAFATVVTNLNGTNNTYPPTIAQAVDTLSSQVLADLQTISGAAGDATRPFYARAVVTTLHAYTGSGTGTLTSTANGAFGTQDGVSTLAAGDVVFVQEGTTNLTAAKDAGPWQISVIGNSSPGVKWILVRPDWWATALVIPEGKTVDIGTEGTLWSGTAWKTFVATATKVVDTDAPVFWVGRVTQVVTLSSGTITVSNVGLRSATKTSAVPTLNTAGGTNTTTVGYMPGTITPGAIGTGSVAINAIAAGLGTQTGDTSTVNVTVINW